MNGAATAPPDRFCPAETSRCLDHLAHRARHRRIPRDRRLRAAVRTLHNMNVPGHPEPPLTGCRTSVTRFTTRSSRCSKDTTPTTCRSTSRPIRWCASSPLYAPLTLLLHLPFGMLSHAHAQEADLALNLLLVPLLALISLRVAGRVPTLPLTLGLATILLLSRPGQMAIYLGQSSVYLVIATYTGPSSGAGPAALRGSRWRWRSRSRPSAYRRRSSCSSAATPARRCSAPASRRWCRG